MFLEHVYHVTSGDCKEIPLAGKMVPVTDALRRECQLIRMMHIISIGVFTMLGSSVSSLFGQPSFLKDLLFITVFLVLLTYLYDKVSYFLLRRKFGK